MKVISGKFRGREIEGFKMAGTRPTMDRVKESLFAMIQMNIVDSSILDLFSGSGNLAIEAISQGARKAWCNDNSREAFRTIQKNIEKFQIEDKVFLTNLDYKKALSFLKEQGLVFDLIFLDPPYQTDYVSHCLFLIDQYQLLKKDGKIICEVDHMDRIPSVLPWSVLKQKKYGDKFVVILG